MFNKNVKVIDCTIRDGGLINKWQFSKEMVRGVYKALSDAGIDYMELGYRASTKMFPPGEFGPWRFTTDEDVLEIIDGVKSDMKLGVMVDIGRVEPDDIKPADESPVKFIRVATYVKDIDKAIWLANHVHEKGYESFINVMAISTVNDYTLMNALKQVEAESHVSAVNVVDSYGSLYPVEVSHLTGLFRTALKTKGVGFHGHNNLQLGFANTIQAVHDGAAFCDATISGIGRAAGNCPLELLMAWLKNPRYSLDPVLQVIQDIFVDLRNKIEWGYLVPYMITGVLNEHPRIGIAMRNTEDKDKYADFFRKLTTPECANMEN
ncbi:MAG: nucleoid-structuring protein H-NS [Lentisphaerae bacterium GWF2_45_14]|nr:MAG: nucleoid-structuring protein H-NS [Lentisphaerae bacterium GWF2_45_14]